jgi:hypothetical protein
MLRPTALAEPSLRGIFMPPLLAKWGALTDTDAELLPLMECLMTIATAVGEAACPCILHRRLTRLTSSALQRSLKARPPF